jgi:hypothetical protein
MIAGADDLAQLRCGGDLTNNAASLETAGITKPTLDRAREAARRERMPSQEHERLEDLELHEQELSIPDDAVDARIDRQRGSSSDARACSFDPFVAHLDGLVGTAELELHAVVAVLGALTDRVAEDTIEEQQ